jgi:L-amino acid N-acyltransferase YncA
VGQSTVSAHLKRLAEVGFVQVEHRGTASLYRINQACVECFPTAADVVMGRPVTAAVTADRSTVSGDPEPGVQAAVIPAERPAAPAGVLIRPMRPADAGQVLSIYQAGLDTGDASFETTAPAWEAFDRARLSLHRHVAVGPDGKLLGWVAVSAVSERRVYAGVVEHSVYVAPGTQRRGIGAALLAALAGSTEAAGIWTIQSGIFPENDASVRLHERAGFGVVGTRRRVGRHHGRWRDVVLMERRSAVAGTD